MPLAVQHKTMEACLIRVGREHSSTFLHDLVSAFAVTRDHLSKRHRRLLVHAANPICPAREPNRPNVFSSAPRRQYRRRFPPSTVHEYNIDPMATVQSQFD